MGPWLSPAQQTLVTVAFHMLPLHWEHTTLVCSALCSMSPLREDPPDPLTTAQLAFSLQL